MSDYLVLQPEQNCGFCGYIWQTIRAIYHNPNKKYYIDFQNCIYKTDNENIWDLFFEQPHIATKPKEYEIEKKIGIIFDQDSSFTLSEITPKTPEEFQRRRNIFNEIIKKYFVLKPAIQSKIDSFYSKNFEGRKILGIHLRGTDHPDKKRMCDYMQKIKEIAKDYEKIFVSTDEEERFLLMKLVYGEKILSWDTTRSKENNIPLHSHPHDTRYARINSSKYQHKIVEDVIIESYLLSRVNYLMCCPGSNVNYLSRAINPNLEYVEL